MMRYYHCVLIEHCFFFFFGNLWYAVICSSVVFPTLLIRGQCDLWHFNEIVSFKGIGHPKIKILLFYSSPLGGFWWHFPTYTSTTMKVISVHDLHRKTTEKQTDKQKMHISIPVQKLVSPHVWLLVDVCLFMLALSWTADLSRSTFPTEATGMEPVIENGWMVTLLFQVKLDSRVFQTIGQHHASSMEAYKYMATNGLHCFGTGRDPEWLCGLEYDTRASANKLLGRKRDEEARAMLGVWFCSENSCSLKYFLIKEGEQTAALKAFLFPEPSLGWLI